MLGTCEDPGLGASNLHWAEQPIKPSQNAQSGTRYVDRCERTEGVWRIAERVGCALLDLHPIERECSCRQTRPSDRSGVVTSMTWSARMAMIGRVPSAMVPIIVARPGVVSVERLAAVRDIDAALARQLPLAAINE